MKDCGNNSIISYCRKILAFTFLFPSPESSVTRAPFKNLQSMDAQMFFLRFCP